MVEKIFKFANKNWTDTQTERPCMLLVKKNYLKLFTINGTREIGERKVGFQYIPQSRVGSVL